MTWYPDGSLYLATSAFRYEHELIIQFERSDMLIFLRIFMTIAARVCDEIVWLPIVNY